jgi:serine/threonine-protein kinase
MRSATESTEQNAKGPGTSSSDVSPEQVRAELDKILASPGFINADRLSRFLRYVVDETLDGQIDKLKETLLGIEVFGRKPTYDPRVDAVVRTEAVKLRARMRDYYETEGREDPVRIDIPKGGYVPAFHFREELVEPVTPPSIAGEALPDSEPAIWKTTVVAIAIVAVLAASVWIAVRKGSRPDGRPELASIAVLPFEDLSSQHDQEYFCDGMTEEIIDALTKVGGFRVVARTSSFAFKGKQQDIREIGKKLNVGAVLEGSVRKYGNKLRVTAQLNSVADGYHLWSETYERELQDVFSVQDEISQAIVNTLQVKLTAGETGVRPKPNQAPENMETYDLYLRGRYHWARWRTEGAEKAIRYFQQAIAKDPNYAPAYAGLADSYCWLGFFSSLAPNEAMPKAREYAQKALQLDDSLSAAHASLGYVKALYDFDWPGAEREFKRAIELSPGLADGHFGYGIAYLAPIGKTSESIREMKLARDLDPLSLATNTYLGLAYEFAGDSDEAITQMKKALELDPTFFYAHSHLAVIYGRKRMFPEFFAELKTAKIEDPSCQEAVLLAYGDALENKRNEALDMVQRMKNPPKGAYVRPTSIAMVYGILGDRDLTMQWLQRAYAERDGMLAYARHEPAYVNFRKDPEFLDLMRRVGLSQ